MTQGAYFIFDLDGPILDVSDKYYRVYADLVGERDHEPVSKAEYWESKRRRVSDGEILRRSNIQGWEKEFRHLRKSRIETQAYLRLDRIWPGVPELLRNLRSVGTLMLVTLRNSRAALEWQLRLFGLRPLFQHVLSEPGDGADEDRSAVKVRLIEMATRGCPLRGWFIGDTETDVQAGQRLGLRTAAVTYGIRTEAHLVPLNPDVLLHSPDRLIQWAGTLR